MTRCRHSSLPRIPSAGRRDSCESGLMSCLDCRREHRRMLAYRQFTRCSLWSGDVSERLSILQQNVEYQLQGQLAPGERLLWSGRPQGGIKFNATDAYRIPVSFLFTGVSLVWTILAIAAGSGFMFVLTGLPFLLFGLYMNFGRFPLDARRRNRTYYALTDRRIIIVSGLVNSE